MDGVEHDVMDDAKINFDCSEYFNEYVGFFEYFMVAAGVVGLKKIIAFH